MSALRVEHRLFAAELMAAQPCRGYRIWLRYSDNAEGWLDLRQLAARAEFAGWREPGAFTRMRITPAGHLAWPGGIALASAALYSALAANQDLEKLFPWPNGVAPAYRS